MFNLALYLQLIVMTITYLLYITSNLTHPLGITLLTVSIALAAIGLYYEFKEKPNDSVCNL